MPLPLSPHIAANSLSHTRMQLPGLRACRSLLFTPTMHASPPRCHHPHRHHCTCFAVPTLLLSPPPMPPTPSPPPLLPPPGLVDISVQKRQTLSRACALGAASARLPLREFVPGVANARLPLTLPAVLEILTHVNATGDWARAIEIALPAREYARPPEMCKAARRAAKRAQRDSAGWGGRAGGSEGGGGGGSEGGGGGSSRGGGDGDSEGGSDGGGSDDGGSDDGGSNDGCNDGGDWRVSGQGAEGAEGVNRCGCSAGGGCRGGDEGAAEGGGAESGGAAGEAGMAGGMAGVDSH
jgi:hypothetical protein